MLKTLGACEERTAPSASAFCHTLGLRKSYPRGRFLWDRDSEKVASWLKFLFLCRYIYSVEYGRVVDTKSGHDDASKRAHFLLLK